MALIVCTRLQYTKPRTQNKKQQVENMPPLDMEPVRVYY